MFNAEDLLEIENEADIADGENLDKGHFSFSPADRFALVRTTHTQHVAAQSFRPRRSAPNRPPFVRPTRSTRRVRGGAGGT
ncbi:hypothetical protein MPC1_230004 [Methylocella tundrae]|nr:hypothetical protein MPC1_230004 [Methylocella tundrae]